MQSIFLSDKVHLDFLGPPLEEGRLPAVFYFALSSEESLSLDPYNQPALFLAKDRIRVFSMNLPAHGPNFNALDAVELWAKDFSEGIDPLTPFIDQAVWAIETLINQGFVIAEKVGLMGLSRGGLIASWVCAKSPHPRALACFSPLTQFSLAKEFAQLQKEASVCALDLHNIIHLLSSTPLHFRIGNRDMRVGTNQCFSLIEALCNEAFEKKERSLPFELVLTPSIGHMGHGTSKESFEKGALWLGKKLGIFR